jgi:hypothetical protein
VASTEISQPQRCHNQLMQRAEPSPAAPARLAGRAHLAVATRVAVGLAGLAAGAGALAVAEGPGRSTTYAGSSAAGAALILCAGLDDARAMLPEDAGPLRARVLAPLAAALRDQPDRWQFGSVRAVPARWRPVIRGWLAGWRRHRLLLPVVPACRLAQMGAVTGQGTVVHRR